MPRILLCILLSVLLLFCFSQRVPTPPRAEQVKAWRSANALFMQAEKLSDLAGDDDAELEKADKIYLQALSQYQSLVPSLEENQQDSLLFFTAVNSGLIHSYFDSLEAAKKAYLKAFSLHPRLPSIPDSFLFKPSLYTGGVYYAQHDYDSAFWYYRKAEHIARNYPKKIQGTERLFNRLGALYYETGNYQKAKIYIEQAIALTDPGEKALLENYNINIAALLVKLEEFEKARILYHRLLPSPLYSNEIYHNLAIISIKEQHYTDAITWLQKITYPNDRKIVDLYYNFALAFSGLNQADSAELYIQRALTENLKWNGRRKNVQLGLIYKYQADELAKQQMYPEALTQYQQAILQFNPKFSETAPDKNPVEFTSAYSFINLFNSLAAKAAAFEGWYQQEKKIDRLEAALDAYRTAFKLAGYVENTYESDEARLLLGRIKYKVHSKPINASLLLYDLTRKKNYLEEAYLFDQQNKASVLAANVEQQEFKTGLDQDSELESEERSLKKAITRLSINAAQITDSQELATIHQNILSKEIELGKVREKLDDDPRWQELMVSERIPAVSALQKKLDNTTAILSYHLSENELLILLITQSRFEYNKTIINKTFFNSIESFKSSLHAASNNLYAGDSMASSLYDKLVGPVSTKLMQIKRLIIIPDDELHYLPFEALRDGGQRYLVEHFAIQYQYSTALINRRGAAKQTSGVLSFAPFIAQGYRDSSGLELSVLPASENEVSQHNGQVFKDKEATKENFIKMVNQYGTIHLATHATVDNKDPSRSYIAFYPKDENFRLFAPEISNLKLDSVQLVILSACETGMGQLVKGEGLMSLSRSFAYAGCPNIITSLWKAEDRTTAFITQQIHHYLGEGYTKDRALQQAKLDLLASDKIDPQLKSPVFWAHLVFIGDYEARQTHTRWWWIAFLFIAGAIVYKVIGKKKVVSDA